MRRKRRSRGTWFPVLGTGVGEDDSVSGLAGSIPINADGTSNIVISPLTFDDPQEDTEATRESQLTEFIGQEYILHSVIGNLLASRTALASGNTNSFATPAVLLVGGLFVARSADDTGQTTDSLPIGATTLAELRVNYSPLSGQTIREPWIWRRAWILGRTPKVNSATGNVLADTGQGAVPFREGFYGDGFPPTTAGYSGLQSGPFFKTKTRRRVRQDERLWLALGAMTYPLGMNVPGGIDLAVDFYLDYRIYGQLVRAHNRSAF